MEKAKVRDLKSEYIKDTGIGLPEALESNSQPMMSIGFKFSTRLYTYLRLTTPFPIYPSLE